MDQAAGDDARRLMDLAAFADHRLDDGESGRLAKLIAQDPDAIEDILVARGFTGPAPLSAVDEAVIALAVALVPGDAGIGGRVIAFPQRRVAASPWRVAVNWSGLAAAMVLAGWLGFDLGSGLPNGSSSTAASASDLGEPPLPLVRDFIEGWQT